MIYLTPDQRPPDRLSAALLKKYQDSGKLCCWSYHDQLRKWLESCRRECAAPKIRDFLSAFIAYSSREPEVDQLIEDYDE